MNQGPESQRPFFGNSADFGVEGGTQAEYARRPFADDTLVTIPDDFSSDIDWLFLSDIFITGWVGLDFAGFQAGDTVAIFGAGPVALIYAYAAILRAASKVYSIDYVRNRLDKAALLVLFQLTSPPPPAWRACRSYSANPTASNKRRLHRPGMP